VTVDATVDYTFEGAGKITGLTSLTKTNSGKLTILAQNDYIGVTTLAGGTLSVSNLADGGLTSPIGAAAADAANLVLNGGTLEYLGTNLTWNRGLTLGSAGGGLSVADAATTLITTGSAAGDGQLVKQGPGRLDVRAVNNHTGGTEIQAGTLRLDRDSAPTLGSGNLSLNGGATEAVFLFGGDGQAVPNPLSITGTNNAISNNGNNTFNDLSGDGTVYLRGGGTTLTFQGDMSTFSGTLIADGLPNLRFNPGTGSSNAVFDLGVGSCLLNNRNGNLTINLGALSGGPSTILQGASSGNNPTTYVIGALGVDTLFEGTISEAATTRKANITKVGSGTLTLSGNSTYTGDTTVSEGTLALKDSALIGSTINITVAAGANLDVSGLFTPTLYLAFGQTLLGNGTINGSVDSSGGGVVAPGTSIGTLTVTGTANLLGTTVMEVNRGSVPKADKIVAATIQLGGTLDLQNLGFNLQPGDTFDLFDAASITDYGVFVQGPAGVTFDTTQLTVNGTISVATVPAPPQITGTSLVSGNNLVTTGTGGTGYGNYRVLSSTAVSAPLGAWTPVQTNVFEFDGSFSFTNVVDPAKATEYFILQHQ
jgi:fibronectin-binding autotransporter adhesin